MPVLITGSRLIYKCIYFHLFDGSRSSAECDLDFEIGQSNVAAVDLESATVAIVDQKSENIC